MGNKTNLTVEVLKKYYVEQQKSTVEIAEMFGLYPEQVRRALKKFNIPVRNRSKASRNYYDKGGMNPRKGYKYTEEEKEKASIVAKEFWLSEDSEEAKKKISESSRRMWDGITVEEKEQILSRLHQAVRQASVEGSKTQKKIGEILRKKYKYKTMGAVRQLAGIGNLEVDIALPEHSIAIEIDGITHFDDVYSDNRYERAREHDKKKNAILTTSGWSVIRVKLLCDRFSVGSCLLVCEELDRIIKQKKYKKHGVLYIEMH